MGSTGAARGMAGNMPVRDTDYFRPDEETRTTAPITYSDGKISITDELKSDIFNITGVNREDILNKVAKLLEGSIGSHSVYTGSSKHISIDRFAIDVVTRKIKGVQTVKSFFVWEKDSRSESIKGFYK